MKTGAILLIGAAGVGLYALSQAQGADASGGGGGGANIPSPSDNGNGGSGFDLSGLMDALKGFQQPSNEQPTQTVDSKKAANSATLQSAPDSGVAVGGFGQTLFSPNVSTANGPAYADSSGVVHDLNFSSATYGATYVSAPVVTTKKAATSSSGGSNFSSALNFTPAPTTNASMLNASYAPPVQASFNTPNFSSATLGAIYVAPPVSTSSNTSKSSTIGSSSSSSTTKKSSSSGSGSSGSIGAKVGTVFSSGASVKSSGASGKYRTY